MNPIETRTPHAEMWSKTVTGVAEKAKTGYDWHGEFVRSDRLEDLQPGTIVITCDNAGSRRNPTKHVYLHVLVPWGTEGCWPWVAHAVGDEWAYKLRDKARELLAMTPEQRVAAGVRTLIEETDENIATLEKRIPTMSDEGGIAKVKEKIENERADRVKLVDMLAALTPAPAIAVDTTQQTVSPIVFESINKLRDTLNAERALWPERHHVQDSIVDLLTNLEVAVEYLSDNSPDETDEDFAQRVLRNE